VYGSAKAVGCLLVTGIQGNYQNVTCLSGLKAGATQRTRTRRGGGGFDVP